MTVHVIWCPEIEEEVLFSQCLECIFFENGLCEYYDGIDGDNGDYKGGDE